MKERFKQIKQEGETWKQADERMEEQEFSLNKH